MSHPLMIAWLCWCYLCGGAGVAAVLVPVVIGADSIARRWSRRLLWWGSRRRRAERLAALEIVIHSIKHLDNRFFSRGIWKELYILPEEDAAARAIILQAWHDVLTEAYR